jgi:hypothetical protein
MSVGEAPAVILQLVEPGFKFSEMTAGDVTGDVMGTLATLLVVVDNAVEPFFGCSPGAVNAPVNVIPAMDKNTTVKTEIQTMRDRR